jgi:hypothetical protein
MEDFLNPLKVSYDAMEFYEGTVDRLGQMVSDDRYPDFPWNTARDYCLTNRDAVRAKISKYHVHPVYSSKMFKEFVAQWFETTIKEMDYHWRHFK